VKRREVILKDRRREKRVKFLLLHLFFFLYRKKFVLFNFFNFIWEGKKY
jgi:hypothetical protein